MRNVLPLSTNTEAELKRIHRHFFHPSTKKLLGLIHQGAKNHHTPHLRKQLDGICSCCNTSQRHTREPFRFRVAMPQEDCVFNRMVGMHIMKINKISSLHVVDKDKNFSAAAFFKGESSENVLETFLECWVASYIVYPDTALLNQGRQFQSSEFCSLLAATGITVKSVGVESHNALGGDRTVPLLS